MGFSRQEYCSGLSCPPPWHFPNLGLEPMSFMLANTRPYLHFEVDQFSSVFQSCLTLCEPMDCSTPSFLFITNSRSLLKLLSIESVMLTNHLTHCHPLLLLLSIFPSIKVFSNESVLHLRWPKYWIFSFRVSFQ